MDAKLIEFMHVARNGTIGNANYFQSAERNGRNP